jgi:hypothetical protein
MILKPDLYIKIVSQAHFTLAGVWVFLGFSVFVFLTFKCIDAS